ncbi:hypothetical protein M5K25_006573 [Dendrobium thyrsiflorum]|uniref:Calcium uniporter protein C-terminal domain-containing protein n=1 Tax=Dendrobium thyrsiflorum TaxID=117978 RepID=A0ABD0VJ06_DENTH
MWRSTSASWLLRRGLAGATTRRLWPDCQFHPLQPRAHLCSSVSSPSGEKPPESTSCEKPPESITHTDAKRLMRLVNVEALKRRLGMEREEIIGYSKLLEACEEEGVARGKEEAEAFARVLDEAGVVLLFRDQVVDLVRRAVPLALPPENDPRHEELNQLKKKKDEIDMLAHKQVRGILWSGLGFFVVQVGLFFRLTFWEFSWDVMEPIAFFTTTAGILVGYAYFLFTSKDPTYQDLMKRLFLSRQRKLLQKKNFNMERLNELQRHCRSPLDRQTGEIGINTR